MKLLRIIGWAISILSIIYVFDKIVHTEINFTSLFDLSSIAFLVLVLAFHIFSLFILARSYHIILKLGTDTVGTKIDYINFYAKTNLAKYLPGNVMHLVDRNVSASTVGASQGSILMGTIFEITFVLTATTLLIFFIKPEQATILTPWVSPLTITIVVSLFLGAILFIGFQIKRRQIQIKFSVNLFFKILSLIILYMLVMIFQALVPVVIALFILKMPMQASVSKEIFNGFLISWTAGFLTLGAPGGIGVREAVFCSLIQDMPQASLLFIGIVQRFVNVLGDVVFFLILFIMANTRSIPNNFSGR
ncbi:MAG TPA: hypothetical protein PKN99_09650 [Cyclobacteriaceae bacterium]|nr:hypothetical protein [Cyclobacteriaceae bacterium]